MKRQRFHAREAEWTAAKEARRSAPPVYLSRKPRLTRNRLQIHRLGIGYWNMHDFWDRMTEDHMKTPLRRLFRARCDCLHIPLSRSWDKSANCRFATRSLCSFYGAKFVELNRRACSQFTRVATGSTDRQGKQYA